MRKSLRITFTFSEKYSLGVIAGKWEIYTQPVPYTTLKQFYFDSGYFPHTDTHTQSEDEKERLSER